MLSKRRIRAGAPSTHPSPSYQGNIGSNICYMGPAYRSRLPVTPLTPTTSPSPTARSNRPILGIIKHLMLVLIIACHPISAIAQVEKPRYQNPQRGGSGNLLYRPPGNPIIPSSPPSRTAPRPKSDFAPVLVGRVGFITDNTTLEAQAMSHAFDGEPDGNMHAFASFSVSIEDANCRDGSGEIYTDNYLVKIFSRPLDTDDRTAEVIFRNAHATALSAFLANVRLGIWGNNEIGGFSFFDCKSRFFSVYLREAALVIGRRPLLESE